MTNSVDPIGPGSTLFASILNSSVIVLGNYLQQTTSADDILDAFFSWRLRNSKWCSVSILALIEYSSD